MPWDQAAIHNIDTLAKLVNTITLAYGSATDAANKMQDIVYTSRHCKKEAAHIACILESVVHTLAHALKEKVKQVDDS